MIINDIREHFFKELTRETHIERIKENSLPYVSRCPTIVAPSWR